MAVEVEAVEVVPEKLQAAVGEVRCFRKLFLPPLSQAAVAAAVESQLCLCLTHRARCLAQLEVPRLLAVEGAQLEEGGGPKPVAFAEAGQSVGAREAGVQ